MSTFGYYHRERLVFTRKLHTDFYNPSLKVKRRNCLILWLARYGLWEKFADTIYFLNRLGRKWGYMWSFVTRNSKSHIYFYNINWWDPQMPKQSSREQHSWKRGPNPLFYEDPPILSTPLFFQILSTFPLPPFLSPPTPTPTALPVVLFLWLNVWLCHIWCAILLNDIMDLHMLSLGTFVPERLWCALHATRDQVYWGLTHNVVFCWYSDLTSHTHKHTHKKTYSTLTGQ